MHQARRETVTGRDHVADPLSPEDFRALVQSGPELMAVLGDGGVLRYGSPALAAALECAPEELLGRSAFEFVDARDAPPLAGALTKIAQGLPTELGLRVGRQRGSERIFRSTVAPFRDCRGQTCAVLRSTVVPPGHRFPEESALARLPNRVAVEDRLERSLRRAAFRTDYFFAVLVVGVDHLELITDTFGLAARDRLLALVAERLVAAVRPGDQVAYLGQGEFSVLVDRIKGPDDAVTVARRIQRCISEPFRVAAEKISLTVGIGIALSGGAAQRPDDVLNDGATAMRRAQVNGPGQYEFFDPAMRARAIARLKLENDLRLAVDRREFRVHYQPIVSLGTGDIAGFEALLRWQHPERGLLPPAAFIAAAEETGLMVPISWRVLLEAAAQVRAWQQRFSQRPRLSLSMNFTNTQFAETSVIDMASDILARTGLDGGSLVVEITERVLLQDVEQVTALLAELRRRQIRVHLDDFGTGYSSLSYLQRLPVDALKIDRSFVSALGQEDAGVMLRAIIDLAHNLGKHVVAEGIETQEQAAALRMLGCEYGQGFYFAQPADGATVELWLADHWPIESLNE